MVAIAQWICQRLQSWGPGFASQAHHVSLYLILIFEFCTLIIDRIESGSDRLSPDRCLDNPNASSGCWDIVEGLSKRDRWLRLFSCLHGLWPVWPDLAIYWTLGFFLKPLVTIDLPKSHPFLGNFCKGVKTIHFSSEIQLGQLNRHLANFIWSHWLWPIFWSFNMCMKSPLQSKIEISACLFCFYKLGH